MYVSDKIKKKSVIGCLNFTDAKPSPPPPMPFQSSPPHRIEVTELVPPVSLRPPPKIEKVRAVEDDGFSNKPVVTKKSSISSIKATVYSVADLQIATDSFSVENLIGEGTFGRVYRAQFNDGKVLAFKICFQSRIHILVVPANILPYPVYQLGLILIHIV